MSEPAADPNTSADVIIVGVGLAGLAAARTLTRAGKSVLVYEGSDGVGGRVRTDITDGFRLDRGFQVLLPHTPNCTVNSMSMRSTCAHSSRGHSSGSVRAITWSAIRSDGPHNCGAAPSHRLAQWPTRCASRGFVVAYVRSRLHICCADPTSQPATRCAPAASPRR